MAGPALLRKPRALVPRHAASLIVVRSRGQSVELLMGRRGARHRFMPNRQVFPGGGVDRADYAAPAASELRPGVRTALEKGGRPPLARALAVAAARELTEETGLSLGAPPALDGLDYLCRAVTPPGHPIRFNARFFVVEALRVTGEIAGSGELEGLRWYELDEALALDLALVTREVTQLLRAWLALSEPARASRMQTEVFRNRRWRLE